jgi:hypothetical protein
MATLPLQSRAVRLDSLIEFVDEFSLWESTTRDVIDNLIKPKTCFLSAAEAFFNSSELGEADIYVTHNWDSSFGCIVAAVSSFLADCIHGHNEFQEKDGDKVNINVGRRLRKRLAKRSKHYSGNASFFGLEQQAYVWIDAIGLSHFEEYMNEVAQVPQCLFPISTDLMLLLVIEYPGDPKIKLRGQKLTMNSLLDISSIVMMLEERQREQSETQKNEALTGLSPSSLSKNKHLKACQPKNVVFVRTGYNSYMDYINNVSTGIRERLIHASTIDVVQMNSEHRSSKTLHGNHAHLHYGNRIDDLGALYLDWAHESLSNGVIETKHFGSGYDSLNRIAKRFLGNMLCLEKDQEKGTPTLKK